LSFVPYPCPTWQITNTINFIHVENQRRDVEYQRRDVEYQRRDVEYQRRDCTFKST
jgi:formate hydrogenlyase subunit 6/NADH:ubiquinone oxidoreductase subunit I